MSLNRRKSVKTLFCELSKNEENNTSICLVKGENGFPAIVVGNGYGGEELEHGDNNAVVWRINKKNGLEVVSRLGDNRQGCELLCYWSKDKVVIVEERRLHLRSITRPSMVDFSFRNCRHFVRINKEVFCAISCNGVTSKMYFGSFGQKKVLDKLDDIWTFDCNLLPSKKYRDQVYVGMASNPKKPLKCDMIIQLYSFRKNAFIRKFHNHTKSYSINSTLQYVDEDDLEYCRLFSLENYIDANNREIVIAGGTGTEIFFYDSLTTNIIRKIHLGILTKIINEKNDKESYITFVTNLKMVGQNHLCVSRNNQEMQIYHIPQRYRKARLYIRKPTANINDWVLVHDYNRSFTLAVITLSRDLKLLNIPKLSQKTEEQLEEEEEGMNESGDVVEEIGLEEAVKQFNENFEESSCKIC